MKSLCNWCCLLILLLPAVLGCTSQIIRVPIDPFAVHDINSHYVKKVAVLPIVVPDYLRGQGGEEISIDVTNQFLSELASRRMYNLVAGDAVRDALNVSYESPRDWVYQGTSSVAVRVGRQLKVDGVIFGVMRRYLQANLTQTEVEIEFQMVEVGSAETIWSVREYFIGRGGSPTLREPVTSPAASVLAQRAVAGAVGRVDEIYQANGPVEVSTISTRQIWGYSLLSAGAVSAVTTGYYFTMSYNAYQQYQDADSSADLVRYRNDTEEYDRMWMIFGGTSLVLLGTGTYLLLTDPAAEFARDTENSTRITLIPYVTPSAFLLGCAGQF